LVEGLKFLIPDVAIVSGLAYGIDGAAHRSAIACNATTVGVLANALPSIQPVVHRKVAADMISQGGAIVTELSSQTKQNGRFFIPRNRIIAGLSAGVVVVESPDSGGSLSTAAFADDYSRCVMAVPGRVTDATSRGCNMLIRNHKAQAVLSAMDIVHELLWELGGAATAEPVSVDDSTLSMEERAFLAHFSAEPISFDELMARSGLSSGALALMLMNLELSGVVRQLPGKIYEKLL
jgi:DNA processing protein